ncbi:nucleotide pyrophosphohydrolase [Chitinimonas lacunae]|uniref:Nucleotide pyrophosphohydrolase n=1 Tax=Chitinimonas lacunae TaxID=1963018 RepID=A0ABV8MQF6_9NEIS
MNDADTTLAELRELVRRFVAARHWESAHQGKNLAMSIAIEAAELMEHFQWHSNDAGLDPAERAAIAEEVADVAIYTLSFCNRLGIDLAAAIAAKVAKNEVRFPIAGAASQLSEES